MNFTWNMGELAATAEQPANALSPPPRARKLSHTHAHSVICARTYTGPCEGAGGAGSCTSAFQTQTLWDSLLISLLSPRELPKLLSHTLVTRTHTHARTPRDPFAPAVPQLASAHKNTERLQERPLPSNDITSPPVLSLFFFFFVSQLNVW